MCANEYKLPLADHSGPRSGLSGPLEADAERLLIGASVYREPADCHALLFWVGERHRAAAPEGCQPSQAPPYFTRAELADMVTACAAAGFPITVCGEALADGAEAPTVFVDRRAAGKLHRLLASQNRQHEVTAAHRDAARYWQWRAAGWPQNRTDVHDLLEARHHLLEAADIVQACELTEVVCTQLHAWGDFGREAELMNDLLARLPGDCDRRARLLAGLGQIAQVTREYAESDRRYRQALHIFAKTGDLNGVSDCYRALGLLAQARGDYATAERRYQQAADVAGQATSPPAAAVPAASPPSAGVQPAAVLATSPAAAGLQAAAPVAAAVAVATEVRPIARPVAPRHEAPAAVQPGAPTARRPRPGPGWRAPGLAAVALTLLALAIAQLTGLLSQEARVSQPTATEGGAGAVRHQAAAWVARQVSRSAIIACDPAMCAALQARGVAAGDLLLLGPAAGDPLGSDVIVATAAVRSAFGPRLTAVYAPAELASFGTRGARIEILVTAPDGTAAYLHALTADVAARRQGGLLLLHNQQISVTAAARRQLAAGAVDSRLLITLATLAGLHAVRVLSFGGSTAGASAGMPLQSAEVTGYLPSVRSFLRAQQAPFVAAATQIVRLPGGQHALTITFACPSPLGLLGGGAGLPGSAAPARPSS